MSKQEVKILADSLSPQGHRLTTFVLKYPRIIAAEVLTHRMFSRNSSSSRAESITKKLERVKAEMFIPDRFAKNCKGMANKEWLSNEPRKDRLLELSQYDDAADCWQEVFEYSFENCRFLGDLDVHKQHANRLLEPFEYITVIVTASEWDGWYQQRAPKYNVAGKVYNSRRDAIQNAGLISCINTLGFHALGTDVSEAESFILNNSNWYKLNTNTAQPEMMELAEKMWDAYNESVPEQLLPGQYHIPFGDNMDLLKLANISKTGYKEELDMLKIKIATARCAKVSYHNHDGKIDYEADVKLYDFLIAHRHLSPSEHCCRILTQEEYDKYGKFVYTNENEEKVKFEKGWIDNIRGFISHRRELGI